MLREVGLPAGRSSAVTFAADRIGAHLARRAAGFPAALSGCSWKLPCLDARTQALELPIELHIFLTYILLGVIALLVGVCVWTLMHAAYRRRVARQK